MTLKWSQKLSLELSLKLDLLTKVFGGVKMKLFELNSSRVELFLTTEEKLRIMVIR